MGMFDNIFGKLFSFEHDPEDGLGDELRAALSTLVMRSLRGGGEGELIIEMKRCQIRGVPVGSWRFTVARIPDAENGTNPASDR